MPSDVERGERVTRSPITGAFYLVTRWIDHGDGKLRALDKEEISDEEVVERLGDDMPDEWRKQMDESLWNEVEADA